MDVDHGSLYNKPPRDYTNLHVACVKGGRGNRELIQAKTPQVLKTLPETQQNWRIHSIFFARAGFTDAARAEAQVYGAKLVDLEQLDTDLTINRAGG